MWKQTAFLFHFSIHNFIMKRGRPLLHCWNFGESLWKQIPLHLHSTTHRKTGTYPPQWKEWKQFFSFKRGKTRARKTRFKRQAPKLLSPLQAVEKQLPAQTNGARSVYNPKEILTFASDNSGLPLVSKPLKHFLPNGRLSLG